MSEKDRAQEQEQPRPKVRVTDKRRVRPEADSEAGGNQEPSAHERSAPDEVERARPMTESESTRDDVAEYRDHLQRLQAEFANYRKRILKEQTRAVELASEPLLRRLLEVLDEFDLALMAAERKPDFERFLHGVELVYAKLQEILRSEGLERIDAEGKPFDPERHEALMQAHDGDGEPYVADVLRQGYMLKGRVIRPAGVKVGRR
jgi:molecular chaperone GrpE